MLIYETKNFEVITHPKPHVSREEGGNIKIVSKKPITDRTKLESKVAIELMKLSMIVGEAYTKAMIKRGVEIVKINYQDMGNWAFKTGKEPVLHLHIYGRTKNAKHQIFPEAVQLPDRGTGFYDSFKPLDEGDVKIIKEEIEKLFKSDKYQDKNWRL